MQPFQSGRIQRRSDVYFSVIMNKKKKKKKKKKGYLFNLNIFFIKFVDKLIAFVYNKLRMLTQARIIIDYYFRKDFSQ